MRPDRTYVMKLNKPPVSYFLKQAAGIQRGAMNSGSEIAGKITLKHVYEIAKIKSQDEILSVKPLQFICNSIIGSARSLGIQVVRSLDADEYGEFLQERAKIVEQQKKELQEVKEAKMLRLA